MHRRVSLLLIPVAPALAVLPLACGEARESPPSVILVVLDTLRADYLDLYGYRRETAPFLARLASEGAVFERTYSSSSWTAPATASLLTGLYPDRHGITRGFFAQVRGTGEPVAEDAIELMSIDSNSSTLAELFRADGYTTIGLATNINIGPEIGFDRGFDLFERHDGWTAGKIFSRLRSLEEDMRDGQPFFLYLHLNDVHKPYELRKRWHEQVEDLFVPESLDGRDAEEVVETVSLYQSEIGYLDHWLERILGAFADDDVLVCVVSDHGEEFMERGKIGHHFSLYNEVNRVLFLLHGPGLGVESGVFDHELSLVDVGPTLLELAGLTVPEELDGISLTALVQRAAHPGAREATERLLAGRPVFAHRWSDGYDLWAVIRGGWKLIEGPTGQQLFRLPSDPLEQENVAPLHLDVTEELSALLDGHRARDYHPDSWRQSVPIAGDILERLRQLGYVSMVQDEQ